MTELQMIRDKIETAMKSSNFQEVTRLSQIASQVQDNEREKQRLINLIDPTQNVTRVASTPPSRRAPYRERPRKRGGFLVQVNLDGTELEICESTAAQTMVILVQRLLAKFGPGVLQKLENIRVSRGPFISKNPDQDYVNGATGELYMHSPIAGTGYYVLTQTDNAQKIKNLQQVFRALGIIGHARKI